MARIEAAEIARKLRKDGHARAPEGVLPPAALALLRAEASALLNRALEAPLDLVAGRGCVLEPHQFLDGDESRAAYAEDFWRFVGDPRNERVGAACVVRALGALVCELNPGMDVFLLNEQFLVKPPFSADSAGSDAFPWHQDASYLPKRTRHVALFSCWTPLEDTISLENGGLVIASEPDSQPKEDHAGTPLTVHCGEVVLLSGTVWHRSAANTSRRFRVAYMPQFIVVQPGSGALVQDMGVGIMARVAPA